MLPTKLLLDLPDGTPKEQLTRRVTFRIKPSDWDEIARIAAVYHMEPSRFTRRLLLLALTSVKGRLRSRR
jgi:hypothetical protein